MNHQQIIAVFQDQEDLLRRYSIQKIYLFGSSAGDEATATSDVDLLVAFEPNARVNLFQFSRLRRELTQALDCEVDLATPDSLHKTLKADILKEAVRAA
jgi:predicted nucleotidyltransferase